MTQPTDRSSAFEIKFTSREVSAWGGMALMKRMLDSMGFRHAATQWDLPAPGSNRGYPPAQLIEQLMVSIWCGACRFTHLDITRLDRTLTRLSLPPVEIWRSYRGRADCENRIKELKNDFGLDSFNLNSFYATEAALGFAMLAYNLMSTFRQAVMRTKIQPTLATLHQQVLAIGAFWNSHSEKNQLLLAVSRRRRAWFEGLWANAGAPPVLPIQVKIG